MCTFMLQVCAHYYAFTLEGLTRGSVCVCMCKHQWRNQNPSPNSFVRIMCTCIKCIYALHYLVKSHSIKIKLTVIYNENIKI